MYEIEKIKQLIFNVKRTCVNNTNSRSTKVNTLRNLYHEMFPETSAPETTPESSEDKTLVGHIDTEEASNEPFFAVPMMLLRPSPLHLK